MTKEPEAGASDNYINYTVKRGESLTSIVVANFANFGLTDDDQNNMHKIHLKVMELVRLNDIEPGDKNNYPILIGQTLRIPGRSQKSNADFPQPTNRIENDVETAVDESKPIRDGSIIHLKSCWPEGGYLDTQGLVHFYSPFKAQEANGAYSFVFTYGGESEPYLEYEGAKRDLTSGSWRILAKDGSMDGKKILVGDKIKLENMYPDPYSRLPNLGLLDVFDDIKKMPKFKSFAEPEDNEWENAKSTFTSHRNKNSSSVLWTILAEGKKVGDPIFSHDQIQLESDLANAGFLVACTLKKVTEIDTFKDWEAQQHFVFTNPTLNLEQGSKNWKIILSHLSHNIYHVETKPNHESVYWDRVGIFEVGGRTEQPIYFLNLALSDDGQKLEGKGQYLDDQEAFFEATFISENKYDLKISYDHKNSWQSEGEWKLGTPTKRLRSLNIKSGDKGYTFVGILQYTGADGPLVVRGRKAKPQAAATTAPDQPLPDHANSMRVVMDSTNRLLREALITLLGGKNYHRLNEIVNVKRVPGKHNSDLMKELEEMVQTEPRVIGSPEDSDYWLQAQQLIKLYILSQDLNHFLLEKLPMLLTNEPFHRLRKTLRLAATDHEMLQRATLQRRWNKHADDKFYVSDHARRVLLMDKLAIMSVVPFQKLLLDDPEQLRVVTYFSTKTHIHHIPYDQRDGRFLLVGVSYDYDRVSPISTDFIETETSENKERALELMAIPHEVGHYIYRYSRLGGQDTQAKLIELGHKEKCAQLANYLNINSPIDEIQADITFTQLTQQLFQNNPYYHWCEEIFADMYGCVIAGPPTVLGMQAMLGATDTDLVWTNDEEHPTPVFRPYIQSEMLRILHELDPKHYPYPTDLIHELDQDWTDAIARWGYERVDEGSGRPALIRLRNSDQHAHIEEIVNVKKVIENVCPILYIYAYLLLSNAEFGDAHTGEDGKLPTRIPWQHGQDEMMKLRDYYDEIEELTESYIVQKEVDTRVSSGFKLVGDVRQPKQTLPEYIENWERSGPHGSSVGT